MDNTLADEIYRYLAGSSFTAGDPLVDDYNVSIPAAGGPQGLLGMLYGLISQKYLGTPEPFSFRNPYERPAGNLGAYGKSRFPSNTQRMSTANGLVTRARSNALSGLVDTGSLLSQVLGAAGVSEGSISGLRNSLTAFIADPNNPFAATASNWLLNVFGAQGFGSATIQAAKHAEGLALGGLTSSQRANMVFGEQSYIDSDTWKDLRNRTLTQFHDMTRPLMYMNGGDSVVRNEKFMRGFSEQEVGAVLEKVMASANTIDPNEIKERMEKVGGAAIKTLEAFRDLFGNAEQASALLNRITSGNLSGMEAEDFDNITKMTRGLMNTGQVANVSSEAVAGMLNLTMVGTRGAMGFSNSDIAGGYATEGIINAVSQTFLGQELADYGVSDENKLDPAAQQRLKSRATWRATQFANSENARSIAAYLYAKDRGFINDAGQEKIEALIASGSQHSLAMAGEMVGRSLGLTSDEIRDPTRYKVFSEYINRNRTLVNEFADLGLRSMNSESRNVMESAISSEGLNIALTAARNAGVGNVEALSNNEKYNSVIRQLRDEYEGGNKIAGSVYNMVVSAYRRGGSAEALGVFSDVRGKLGESGEEISTNAAAAAANAINRITYQDVSDDLGQGLVRIFKQNGAGDRISRSDASKVFKNMAEYYEGTGQRGAAAEIRRLTDRGDFSALSDFLRGNVSENAVAYAFSDVTFGNKGPEEVSGSRKKLRGRQITADSLGLSDESDTRDRKKDWNSLDDRAKMAVVNAYNEYSGTEYGKDISGNVILAAAARDSGLSESILKAVRESGGTVSTRQDIDTDTLAGTAGKTAIGDVFNGEMVAINSFTESVKNVGDSADITTKKLVELGTAIQNAVDENEQLNTTPVQAALNVVTGQTEGDIKKAGAALGGAILNPNNTPEQNEQIVNALGDMVKSLFSAFPIDSFIQRIATAIGEAVGSAVGVANGRGPSGAQSVGEAEPPVGSEITTSP